MLRLVLGGRRPACWGAHTRPAQDPPLPSPRLSQGQRLGSNLAQQGEATAPVPSARSSELRCPGKPGSSGPLEGLLLDGGVAPLDEVTSQDYTGGSHGMRWGLRFESSSGLLTMPGTPEGTTHSGAQVWGQVSPQESLLASVCPFCPSPGADGHCEPLGQPPGCGAEGAISLPAEHWVPPDRPPRAHTPSHAPSSTDECPKHRQVTRHRGRANR